MKTAAPGAGPDAAEVVNTAFEDARLFTTSTPVPQLKPLPIAEASLNRLRHLRRSLDCWHAAGRVDRLPQPADFGLKLPPLGPAQVLWGAA